jgi:primary-amine oxidase
LKHPSRLSRGLVYRLALAAAAILGVTGTALHAQTPVHPLDQLSAREHWAIYDALQASDKLDSTFRLLYEGLKEPAKSDVLAWQPGQPLKREATVHLTQGKFGYEAVVDVTNKKLLSWTQLPGKQFMTSGPESEAAGAVAMKDPRVKEALRKRGVTDFTHVSCSPANNGFFDLPEERNARVLHLSCDDERGRISGYSEAFDGLVVVVDLTNEKVLRIVDVGGVRSGLPDGHSPEEIGPTRAPVNAVTMVQPKGATYTLNGHEVEWQNWKFHFRMDMRRGLVLSRVRYVDAGKERSVMYQGSLSELFVPYMDPADPWNYQGYFDLGTYPFAFGGIASSLEPGVECPDYATYFHSYVVTAKGAPRERQRTACLFERNTGDVAWRHTRAGGGVNEARPRTDLVLRMYMNAGNYDYLFDWVLSQDGAITVNLGATGMDQVKAATGTPKDNDYGRMIANKLVGVNHSHFFSFRLDMDVDGTQNSLLVDKLQTTTLPKENPRRSIWTVNTTTAQTEKDGMRMSAMNAPEVWRIVNPAVNNAFGWPVGYEIEGHGAMSLMSPDDYMRKRAGFVDHTLWTTPYAPAELYASGDYPTNSVANDGLTKWTSANRAIANTDVVTWLTLGFHHVPRPEDWPVMPVAWHSFAIKPVGFFGRSPAIDIPRQR